ncbi:50S ribosomal protein L25 [bacterium]|jgi:large subunit ribosomal protein L25|nr:50S ribosomal protein L25 [bacterium]
MGTVEIEVEKRTALGKNKVNKLRPKGFIPCIIYGEEKTPTPITLELRLLQKAFNRSEFGKNAIITLQLGGSETESVISHKFEYHPLKNSIIHVDFLRVSDAKVLEVRIPITIVGTAAGQRVGGILLKGHSTIRVECLPKDIPTEIVVDISSMKLGAAFSVGELNPVEGVTVLSDKHDVLATVEVPRAEKSKVDEGEAAEGETAEGAEGETAEGDSAEGSDSSDKQG